LRVPGRSIGFAHADGNRENIARFQNGDLNALIMTRSLGLRGLDFPDAEAMVMFSAKRSSKAMDQELCRIRGQRRHLPPRNCARRSEARSLGPVPASPKTVGPRSQGWPCDEPPPAATRRQPSDVRAMSPMPLVLALLGALLPLTHPVSSSACRVGRGAPLAWPQPATSRTNHRRFRLQP
jgi:hypothetical protein